LKPHSSPIPNPQRVLLKTVTCQKYSNFTVQYINGLIFASKNIEINGKLNLNQRSPLLEDDKLKIAVIGCGYWGPNLIRNFSQLHQVDKLYCCDLDSKKRERVKALFPYVEVMEDYKELLAMPDLDGAVIATPVYNHYPLAKKFLEQGKHVLVEKPLTHSLESSLDLIKTAEEQNRILMVGHTFEYTAAVNKIKEIVESGELGKVLYVNCTRVNLGLFQKDINVVWDLAPHDISIILYVLGEFPVSVSCQGRAHFKSEIEDVAITTLNFKSGLIAFIHNSWLDPKKIRKTTIVGTRKMLVYDDLESQEKIKIYDKGLEIPPYYDTYAEFHFAYRSGDIYSPRVDEYEPLRKQCDTFLECIKKEINPPSDGDNGLRVVAILEASSKSLKRGGKEVPMRLPKEKQAIQTKGNGYLTFSKILLKNKKDTPLRVLR
jgi:predicted dehydrogenase